MIIQKVALSEDIMAELIRLSSRWEQEESCRGYRRNAVKDLQGKDVFVAMEETNIIGYLLCHGYVQDGESCTVPNRSSCLEIEEIYMTPEHRGKGTGRKLYQFAIDFYGREIDYVTLSTATKNYQSILRFYIEKLGMNFWHARLFQKLEH